MGAGQQEIIRGRIAVFAWRPVAIFSSSGGHVEVRGEVMWRSNVDEG